MAYGGSIGHVTDDVIWPRKVKVVTQIYKMPIISKMVGDRDRVAIEHLLEMAFGNQIVTWPMTSNGHVTGNVTGPWQVEVVIPICWGPLP